MLVTFWGTRGSISTPGPQTEKYGGNTSCVSVRQGSTIIIFDAGTGIRELGLRLTREYQQTGTPLEVHLMLSHTHWDHIQGLPFFSPAYLPDTKLNIYGSPKKGRFLAAILAGQMDTQYFPVSMNEWKSQVCIKEIKNHCIDINGIEVVSEEQHYHPGGSMRFRISSGEAKIVYASDVELDAFMTGRPSEKSEEQQAHAAAYRAFINDVDLLIGDGQYTPEEYKRCAGWGHTSMPVLAEVASSCGVKRLACFHHDPQHSDHFLDRMAHRIGPEYAEGENPMSLFFAREGMTLSIG
jgi:phosphoribosyl 1,2-cyclic phosphodiesterase